MAAWLICPGDRGDERVASERVFAGFDDGSDLMRPLILLSLCVGGCYDDPLLINPYELTTAGEELERQRQEQTAEPPAPLCGNGQLDEGEQCDDGNRIDRDGCSNWCEKGEATTSLRAVPVVDAVAGSRRFDRNGLGEALIAPFQPVRLSGRDSVATAGGVIAYEWSIEAQDGGSLPPGSQVFFDDPTKDRPRLMYSVRGEDRPGVDVLGRYSVALRVQDQQGSWSSFATVSFEAKPNRALWIELTWDRNDHDVDLHLIRTGDRNLAFDAEQDCYFRNCIPPTVGVSTLNWGSRSEGDDPFLDVDDVDGLGPEVISIPSPEDNMTYLIALHMFRLDFAGATTVSLKVLVDGEVVSELSREMGSHNDWWEAVRLTWGDEVDVEIVDEYFNDAPNGP